MINPFPDSRPRISPIAIGWLAVLLFTAAVVVFAVVPMNAVYNPPFLFEALNVLFLCVISFLVSYLAAASFLAERSLSVLLLGCGTLALGLGGGLAVLTESSNWKVTIFNVPACLASLCHLLSAAGSASPRTRRLRLGRSALPIAYLAVVAVVFAVAIAVQKDVFPVFFVEGTGGTGYDKVVLWTAAGTFMLSALLLRIDPGDGGTGFRHWYAVGLALIAVGLVSVSLETRIGSPLNWTGRASQYLGCLSMLAAVVSTAGTSGRWGIPLERALQESELRYRSLIDMSPDGILVHSEGRYVFANPSAARLLGASSPDDVVGRNMMDLIAPEYRQSAAERVERAYAGELVPLRETKFLRLDGQVVDVETSGIRIEFGGRPAIQVMAREVTERKIMEERLRHQAEMLEHAPVLVRDLNDRVILWNSGMERLYGYTRDEALGKVTHDLLQTRHPLPHTEIIATICREGRWEGELRHRRRDGTLITVTSLQVLHVDAQGNPTAIIEINNDISKRKEYEEAIQQARNELELRVEERTVELSRTVEALRRQTDLLSLAEDAIVVRDSEERIVYWNRGAEKTYGWTQEEALGKAAFELLRAGSSIPLEHIRRKAQDEGHWEGELAHVRKDGVSIVVASRWAVRHLPEGEVETLEINRDVTERTRAEEATRAAGLYARGLLEASLDPLVTISQEGKITDVNKATEEATGVMRDRLIGTDFSSYFTEPDKAARGYRKVLSEGSVRDYPLTIRHVSGGTMDVLYSATLYRGGGGEVRGVFAAARDITERKRNEAELEIYRRHLEDLVKQRTRELEHAVNDLARSNKDLEQFAYVASHDLKEPLRMVTGFLDLLVQSFPHELDEKSREYIAFAVDGGQRMQSLIDDLLAYSRAGRIRVAEATNLDDILTGVERNLRLGIEESGAVITHDPLPTIAGNPVEMQQVLQNLVGNAIKFRGEKKPLIHVGARSEDGNWVFWVKDNGIGINPQFAERIFMIFQRLHTRDKYPGTGIGLAICKKIVERYGGRIWVESKQGEGSTFFFTISKELGGGA